MKSGRYIIIALMLFFLGAEAVEAAPKQAVRRATPAKPSNTSVLAAQLALNSYRPDVELGTACDMANFKNLAIAMNINRNLLNHEKDEFIKNSEYDDLVSKVATVMEEKPIIFCETLSNNDNFSFKYNADAEVFEVFMSKYHNVWRDVKRLGTYRSKTIMGVTANVSASIEFQYNADLSLPEIVPHCLKGRNFLASESIQTLYTEEFKEWQADTMDKLGGYKLHVPVSIVDAPALKRNGRVAFIAKLERPYISEETSSSNPTLDEPYDVTSQTLTIYARLQKILIISPLGKQVWSCNLETSKGH